jgi:hypothetical protein
VEVDGCTAALTRFLQPSEDISAHSSVEENRWLARVDIVEKDERGRKRCVATERYFLGVSCDPAFTLTVVGVNHRMLYSGGWASAFTGTTKALSA